MSSNETPTARLTYRPGPKAMRAPSAHATAWAPSGVEADERGDRRLTTLAADDSKLDDEITIDDHPQIFVGFGGAVSTRCLATWRRTVAHAPGRPAGSCGDR